MRFVRHNEFALPGVYFTQFDRTSYTQWQMDLKEVDELVLDLERRIKLLSLLKGHITVAASHLIESELAQEFVIKHPILLEEKILVPALAATYRNFTELVEVKRDSRAKGEAELYSDGRPSVAHGYPRPSELARFLDEKAALCVRWNARKTREYFRQRLIADLTNKDSLLRINLMGISDKEISRLVKQIQSVKIFSRNAVNAIAGRSDEKAVRLLVPSYSDFIYYLAGALAVNCEGVLPQENLIDFSFTDLVNRKTRLSEYDIFYKIFIDIIESRVQKYLPADVLDRLSFREVVDLRSTLQGKNFIEKYNRVVELPKAVKDVSDPERLVLNMKELDEYETELRGLFRQCIELEVCKKEEIKTGMSGLRVLGNVAKVVTFLGTAESVYKVIVNLMGYFGMGQYHVNLEKEIGRRLKELRTFVDTSSQLEKPIFLEFLKEVTEKYKAKVI